MHNAILALTWTKLSCRTSQNVTSYVTVYMCYIMSFKTNNYILSIYFFFFHNTFGLRCAKSTSEYLSLCLASL